MTEAGKGSLKFTKNIKLRNAEAHQLIIASLYCDAMYYFHCYYSTDWTGKWAYGCAYWLTTTAIAIITCWAHREGLIVC